MSSQLLRDLQEKRRRLEAALKASMETTEGKAREERLTQLTEERKRLQKKVEDEKTFHDDAAVFVGYLIVKKLLGGETAAAPTPPAKPRYRLHHVPEEKSNAAFDERIKKLGVEEKKLTAAALVQVTELQRRIAAHDATIKAIEAELQAARHEYDVLYPFSFAALQAEITEVANSIQVAMAPAPVSHLAEPTLLWNEELFCHTVVPRSITPPNAELQARRDIDSIEESKADIERQIAEVDRLAAVELKRIADEKNDVFRQKQELKEKNDREFHAKAKDTETYKSADVGRPLSVLLSDMTAHHGKWAFFREACSVSEKLSVAQEFTNRFNSTAVNKMSAHDRELAMMEVMFIYSTEKKRLVMIERTGFTWDFKWYYEESPLATVTKIWATLKTSDLSVSKVEVTNKAETC